MIEATCLLDHDVASPDSDGISSDMVFEPAVAAVWSCDESGPGLPFVVVTCVAAL